MNALTVVFPITLTHPIALSLLCQKHAQALFSLIDDNRDYLKEFLGWLDGSLSPDDSEKFIDHARKQFEEAVSIITGIFFGDQLVGIASIQEIDWAAKEFSLGYWIGASYQGHGIVTCAVGELMKVGFEQLDLQKAIIYAAVENQKSQAIPLRLGFTKAGIIKDRELLYGKKVDHIQFVIVKQDVSL